MRFKGFILDEGRSKHIDEYDAIPMIKKHCQKAVKARVSGSQLFRGVKGATYDFIDIKPSQHYRESANTNNMYTLIIDNSPKWKKYPKRSQSIIMANYRHGASSYGDLYWAFPYDGSNYGICSETDIWGSFGRTLGNSVWLDNVNSNIIDDLTGELKIQNKNIGGFGELKTLLKEIDRKIDMYGMDVNYRFNWMQGRYEGDMLKMLQGIIDPGKNGFKQTTDPNKIPPASSKKELWTDGRSILVKEYWAREMMDKLIA